MVLLLTLLLILLILIIIAIVTIGVGGTVFIVIFGDVLVFILVLIWLLKKLFKRS